MPKCQPHHKQEQEGVGEEEEKEEKGKEKREGEGKEFREIKKRQNSGPPVQGYFS